jgi:Fic family protein
MIRIYMTTLSSKQQKLLSFFLKKGSLSSSQIYNKIKAQGEEISLVTIKRALSEMVNIGVLLASGAGRSSNYTISVIGRIFADVDIQKYCSIEPDQRYGLKGYNFDLISALSTDIFTDSELNILEKATEVYERRTSNVSEAIQKKELERLIIELSWKSSKIEGNTYTLLDTEKLILENKEAPGHDKKEAQMILNHKDAFNYILKNSSQFSSITRKNLEELHAILVKDLSIDLGLRKKAVGVIGSSYRPLDNVHQISEAVDVLSKAVSCASSSYAKALVSILGISYIQPFDDGNKRTGRLMANAILISHGLAPLSYRSVDEGEYRGAMLVFYELNSIVPFKKIFVGQYDFAARNYSFK